MTRFKREVLISVLLMLTLLSVKSQPIFENNFSLDKKKQKQAEAMQNFRVTWNFFARAVIENDMETVKRLSATCVRSTFAFPSDEEDSLFRAKYPDSYVPIDIFLKVFNSLVFDSTTKSRLLNSQKLVFFNDSVKRKLYNNICVKNSSLLRAPLHMEVLVTAIDHSEEIPGLQKAFAFIQSRNGYKFCGYSTIP